MHQPIDADQRNRLPLAHEAADHHHGVEGKCFQGLLGARPLGSDKAGTRKFHRVAAKRLTQPLAVEWVEE